LVPVCGGSKARMLPPLRPVAVASVVPEVLNRLSPLIQ
jgi:hypothetical protein